MKKWCLFLMIYFGVCLLAACAGGGASPSKGAEPGGTSSEEPQTGGETTESGQVTETFRLVDAGDGGRSAVLAKVDGRAGDVYTLDIFSVEDVTIEGYTQEQMACWTGHPRPAPWWRSPGTAR